MTAQKRYKGIRREAYDVLPRKFVAEVSRHVVEKGLLKLPLTAK